MDKLEINKPNLFSYATSELSQDAFICWLLSWASPEYKTVNKALHECALVLIKSFFSKHSKPAPESIDKVEVHRQYCRIDVLCIVNEIYPILIEDKTGTKNHSDQLEKYFEEVKGLNYDESNILPIYFKTFDQACYKDVISKGYQPFLRSDFLDVLTKYNGNSEILSDYRQYLEWIENRVQSYKSRKLDEWDGWYSWIGFYLELQKLLKDGDWGPVANPAGGFLGYWWKSRGNESCKQYLQLEQKKMCFKIMVKDEEERSSIRSKWHREIMERSNEFGLSLTKPRRFGNGRHMTVCVFNGDYRITKNGIIDLDATLERLRKAESLLESVS